MSRTKVEIGIPKELMDYVRMLSRLSGVRDEAVIKVILAAEASRANSDRHD